MGDLFVLYGGRAWVEQTDYLSLIGFDRASRGAIRLAVPASPTLPWRDFGVGISLTRYWVSEVPVHPSLMCGCSSSLAGLTLRQCCLQLLGMLVGDGDQGLAVADPPVEGDDSLLQTNQPLWRLTLLSVERRPCRTASAPSTNRLISSTTVGGGCPCHLSPTVLWPIYCPAARARSQSRVEFEWSELERLSRGGSDWRHE